MLPLVVAVISVPWSRVLLLDVGKVSEVMEDVVLSISITLRPCVVAEKTSFQLELDLSPKLATNLNSCFSFSATIQGLRVTGMDRTISSTTSGTLPTSRRRTRGRAADTTATTSGNCVQ